MTFMSDPVNYVAAWLMGVFTGWGWGESLANAIIVLLGAIALITFAMVLAIFLVWIERKVVARFQDRLGPNRIGPFGIFQPFADIIKLILKEDTTPAGANKFVFNLAPILSLASVLVLWAILPLAATIYGVDLNVALMYVVAAGSIGTLAIIMAGWASNNKFALMGAFRMVATMISYEIPMIVALLIPTVLVGSMSLKEIVNGQATMWFVLVSPLGALIFLISAIAELGRAPFDMHEAESEIIAGFHIEYSGMKFGLFFAGELLHAFTFGGFLAILFFGGYRFFGLEELSPFLAVLIFMLKSLFGYWLIMWIKYTVPRIRIDHMLGFNWKFLTPLAFVLLMVTALLDKVLHGATPWVYGSVMFLSNVVIGWAALEITRKYSKSQREAAEIQVEAAAQAAHH